MNTKKPETLNGICLWGAELRMRKERKKHPNHHLEFFFLKLFMRKHYFIKKIIFNLLFLID